jgi:hypothetical protein
MELISEREILGGIFLLLGFFLVVATLIKFNL